MQKPIVRSRDAWCTLGYAALLVAIALAIHWRWFRPGIVTDQDWWNYTQEGLRALWPFPSAYNFAQNIGADWRTNINYFPMEALVGGLGRLGLGVGLAERIGVVFPTIVIAPIAAFVFARQYLRSNVGAFTSALFYANNAYIGVIIARGQLTIAQSYALVPLAATLSVLAVRKQKGGVLYSATAAISLAWAIACDVRIGLLGLVAIALLVMAEIRRENILATLRRELLFALSLASLLCYIWLPILTLHLRESPPLNYTNLSWLAQLSHAWPIDLLTSYKPFWFDNQLHHGPPFFLLFLPLLAIGIWKGSQIFGRRRSAALLAIYVAASVCAIGDNSPFGVVYGWLFAHSWFFAMFRDPSKFYAPAMLAYAVFIGIATEWAAASLARQPRVIAGTLVGAIGLICLAPSVPILDGAQHQLNDPKVSSPSEDRLTALLASDKTFSRVLWGVSPDPLVPGDERHPQVDALWFAGVTENGMSVYSSADSLLTALHMFGVRYIVLRRGTAKGLQYPPAFSVYRTLAILARQEAFGKPIWENGSFDVFRLGNRVSAFEARYVPSYAIYGFLGEPGLYARHVIRPPAFERGVEHVPHDAAEGTLLVDEGARRATATPAMSRLAFIRTDGGVRVDLPDWTGYIMLQIRALHTSRAASTIVLTGTGGTQRYTVRLTRATNYVTLPTEGFGHSLYIEVEGLQKAGVNAAYRIDSSYVGLIDPNAIALSKPSRRIAMLLPLSAQKSKATAKPSGFRITAEAAPVKFSVTLPRTVRAKRYWLPVADTPLWHASGGLKVASPQAGPPITPVNIRSVGGHVILTSEADGPLRKGVMLSAFAFALILGCIVLELWFSLRAKNRNTSSPEIIHT